MGSLEFSGNPHNSSFGQAVCLKSLSYPRRARFLSGRPDSVRYPGSRLGYQLLTRLDSSQLGFIEEPIQGSAAVSYVTYSTGVPHLSLGSRFLGFQGNQYNINNGVTRQFLLQAVSTVSHTKDWKAWGFFSFSGLLVLVSVGFFRESTPNRQYCSEGPSPGRQSLTSRTGGPVFFFSPQTSTGLSLSLSYTVNSAVLI